MQTDTIAAILVLLTVTTQIATQEIRDGASQANKELAASKCKEYQRPLNKDFEYLPLVAGAKPEVFTVPVCEEGGEQLIVGGQPARDGEFPHMAAIGYRNLDGSYRWSCGGTLISARYVLTAAHCKDSRSVPAKVRLGLTNLTGGFNPNLQEFNVETFFPHELYRRSNRYHDIALIKLDSDVRLTKKVRPACLFTGTTSDSSNVIATGWGRTNAMEGVSDILLKVGLQIFRKEACQKIYSKDYKQGFTDDLLCAGHSAGGKDTCEGDSGGPLVVSQEDRNCVYYVIGVTSIGKYCGAGHVPSVYSTVATHLDWIAKRIW